jgi:hypothetical protein
VGDPNGSGRPHAEPGGTDFVPQLTAAQVGLAAAGFMVSNLEGGLDDWTGDGRPTV